MSQHRNPACQPPIPGRISQRERRPVAIRSKLTIPTAGWPSAHLQVELRLMTVDPGVVPGLLILVAELLALSMVGYVVARVALRQDDDRLALA